MAPQPINRDHEEFLDALAYWLATYPLTSGISWILGDIGMGPPLDNPAIQLPWGYISAFNESVAWATADGRGGQGGLAAGLDDWMIPVSLTVAFATNQYYAPFQAIPQNAYSAANLGTTPPYFEQPGWREAEQITQKVKGALRENITVSGEVATTKVTESRYILLSVQSQTYRAARITIQAQQRRTRGT